MLNVRESQESVATLTSKGQITIPIAIRRLLGLRDHDRLLFMVSPAGDVTIRPLKFPDLDSLAGAAGSLREPGSEDEVARAYEERLGTKYRRR